MALILDELKPLRMYKGKFFYPFNDKDRMKNGIIYLLTPNQQSSIEVMNNPFASLNRIMYRSYFLEKNIQYVINDPTKKLEEDTNLLGSEYNTELNEAVNMDGSKTGVILEDTSLMINEDGLNTTLFFPEEVDAILEASTKTKYGVYNFSNIFRKMLYMKRIRTQKEVLKMYEKIKAQVPHLKYTYVDPKLYKGKNLYYDWSYYTEAFFNNIPRGYIGERGNDLLYNYLSKFLGSDRFGTYTQKTIVVPIDDWITADINSINYMKSLNPISMLLRMTRNRLDEVKKLYGNFLILFLTKDIYFTLNINEFKFPADHSKLTGLIKRVQARDFKDAESTDRDSKRVIVMKLADRIERDSNIKLNNLSGGSDTMTKKDLEDTGLLDNPNLSDNEEIKKAALVNKLDKIADKSTDIDDAEKTLKNPTDKDEETWLKELLVDLASKDGTQMNAARISRMNQTKKDILGKEIAGKSISQLMMQFRKNDDIEEESIPIDSIDEDWKHVKFTNFNKSYELDPDITAMFMHFQDTQHPMNVLSIEKENTSTSEDYQETWTCQYEDAETGKRFTMKLDIPTLMDNRFMKLRGNEKILLGQLMLLPITKTGADTVQVVSNYNKIFIRRKSPSGLSKSTPIINKLVKALDKYEGKDFKVYPGDNSKVCTKYELPMEFVDIASLYSKIVFKDESYISFNMDELVKIPFDRTYINEEHKKLPEDKLNQIYLGVYVKNGKRQPIFGSLDMAILTTIQEHDTSKKFADLYIKASVAKRLMYSDASIMSTDIPVGVLLSYLIGLQTLLNKMNVEYRFSETRPIKGETYFKFNDGYLAYTNTTNAQNLILNGLMNCDFSDYSIKEINSKDLWLDMLDNFGGRIKADGFDNFYDLMFDPITKEICHMLNIPDNFIDGMIYASNLLVDNKYIKHTDIGGNRLRTNEVIVGHLYLVLAKAYGAYRNMIKRNKSQATFTAKRSAVIDSLLNHDQTSGDLTRANPLQEAEAASKVTFKGLSGMNSDRAFSIDKRTYDKSMLGVLGLSTGFASTVGINRQTTIDAGVINKRGFVKTRDPKELSNINTFTVMEALSPMAVNHDDPIRTCMAFTQTVQHQMTVKKSMPNLVTTGADEALPYITSNKFAYKCPFDNAKVIDMTADYIIIQDTDTNQCDYIDIREVIQKNSDGGFYITTKLDPIVKVGDKIKKDQIIAYNKGCYGKAIGEENGNDDKIAYNIGTLAKVAIMDTDLGYEDSCVVDNTVSEALATEFVVQKDINLPRNSNVYNLVKIGDQVQEGDALMIFQDAFDEKEANELLRSLSKENEVLSDLGRKQIHAKVTGVIQDIKVYRTCDIELLSPTLQKLCNDYDAKINKLKKVMDKYHIDKKYTLESTGKLPMEGKLKATEGVKIEFYIKVYDKFGIGDKLVFSQALKGVNSYIIPPGDEAYTDFRKNEHINAFLTIDGVMARMVSSALTLGLTNKILIELARSCQEKLGIKWRPMQDILKD